MFLVTFSTDGDAKNKPGCNQFFHPAGTGGRESDIEYFFTLGGTRLTQHPVGPNDVAQMFHRLKVAAGNDDAYISPVGITLEEYLGVDAYTGEHNLIIGQDVEKSRHASYTGAEFGGGRALLLDFKGVGDNQAASATNPSRGN